MIGGEEVVERMQKVINKSFSTHTNNLHLDNRIFHTLTCSLQGNLGGLRGSNYNNTLNPWLGGKVSVWSQITKDISKKKKS